MKREARRTVREAAESLRGRLFVATSVDHPLLLSAPDVLLASPGNLVGWFLPTSAEASHPDRLKARLALSRLALPPTFRGVLVLDETTSHLESEFRFHFHSVVSADDRRGLARVATDPDERGRAEPVPVDLRTRELARFGARWTAAMEGTHAPTNWTVQEAMTDLRERGAVAGRHDEAPRGVGVDREPWWPDTPRAEERPVHLPWGAVRVEDAIVAPLPRAATIARVRDLASWAAEDAYELDYGVPHRRRSPSLALVAAERPHRGPDPDKLIRAACFAGWEIEPPGPYRELVPRLLRRRPDE